LSLFNELKRRNVIKVGIGYVLIAWLIAQVLQLVFESFGTPGWAIKSVLTLLAAGWPFALFFAWVYEMTPDGLRRESDLIRSRPIDKNVLDRIKHADSTNKRLCLMVYKSRCKEIATWELVDSILDSSSRNNPENNITGVLVATKTHFLQILEGEFEALNETFERISRDPRHDQIQLISFADSRERKFGAWAMHGVGLFDLNQSLELRLREKFGEKDGIVQLPTTLGEVTDMLHMMMPKA
jgi:hypothetical protein